MKRSTRGGRQASVALLGLVLVMLGGLGVVALASAQAMPSPSADQPMLEAPHGDRLPSERRHKETQGDQRPPNAEGLRAPLALVS
ncbi:hypothetical protein [Ideonella dechloratans]|uniref:hypothetical protein n=1 Tax=Ideonella dechloratans TaxID=36863 RepID=UPI0035AD9914